MDIGHQARIPTGRAPSAANLLLFCLVLTGCSSWIWQPDSDTKTIAPLSQEAVDEALRAPELTQAVIHRAAHQPEAMVQDLQTAANKGNPIAQQQLGQLYRTGNGVTRDDAAAFHWTRLAAEQGLGEAQVILAQDYFTGRGTAAETAAGRRWLQLAEAQERPVIWVMAGQLYLAGAEPRAHGPDVQQTGASATGLAPDPVKAVSLFRKAAEAGDDGGDYAMCLAQMKGIGGLTASRAEAQPWCDRAAARGNLDARQYSTAHPQLPPGEVVRRRPEWVLTLMQDVTLGAIYLIYAFVSEGGINAFH